MAEIKVGVNTNGSDPAKAINEITREVNGLAKAVASAGKVQFKPVDVATATKDLQTLNKQFEQAIKQSRALRDALKSTGQTGKGIQDVDFSKLSVDQGAAQRMRDKAFGYSAKGTAWDMGNFAPVPGQPNPANPGRPSGNNNSGGSGGGFAGKAAGAFSNGVGGGFGQIANGAIKGAQDGAADGGGAAGGAAGLMRGGLIGAAVLGLFKAGQAVSEGYGMAKDRDTTLDSLKRQMGDLGISFSGLKAMTDEASKGLGVNSKEFAQLSEQYNKISRNPQGQTVDGLGREVQGAVGFSRAYGMDPSQGVGFFGGMKNIDPRQNNRELALQIAEAISKSGGRAMAGDVMQFVQSMSSAMARLSLSTPDSGAYAAAFGSMLHGGSSGMTADAASAILGQANSAMSNMGNAGEAGKNFTLGSFAHQGSINPYLASSLASGGLFATRGSTFGADTEIGKYLRNNGMNPDKDGTITSGNRDISNFQSIRGNLDQQFVNNPLLKLDAAKNFFGLQSNQQAAAMMNLDPRQMSGLSAMVRRAGVDPSRLNAGGIKTIADIGGAKTAGDLDSIYGDIKSRHGKDSLSADEMKTLDSAKGQGFEKFQDALVKIMAVKDQQNTEAKDMLAGIKSVESAQITVGDKLLGPMNTMRDALLKLAGHDGKSATAASLRRAAFDAERGDVDEGYNAQVNAIRAGAKGHIDPLQEQRNILTFKNHNAKNMAAIGALDAQIDPIQKQAAKDIAEINAKRAVDLAAVNAREKQEQGAAADLTKIQGGAGNARDADSSAPSAAGSSGAVGERNNNPFDMRPYAKGQPESGGFLKFNDMQTGVNAGFKNLLVAQDMHHRNTISDIVRPYAPQSDHNQTDAYIANVSKMTGFGKDDQLNLHDPKVLRALGKAMLKQENANNSVTDSQIDNGVYSALGVLPSKIAGQKKGDGATAANDTLNVNVNVNTTGKNAQGATVQQTIRTQVAVPRSSGVTTVQAS